MRFRRCSVCGRAVTGEHVHPDVETSTAMPLEAALEAIDGKTSAYWRECAWVVLDWLIASDTEWNCDDVWRLLARYYPDALVHDRRALGPLINSLLRAGRITQVSYTKSTRPVHHRAHLCVYLGV